MRTCSQCRKEDKPWLDEGPCCCGLPLEMQPNPLLHAYDCKALGHEVVNFPVRMAVSELTFDRQIPPYFSQRGWVLVQNGSRWYRVKPLCRACIMKEEEGQALRREYARSCKAARGMTDQTYAQMLAQQ